MIIEAEREKGEKGGVFRGGRKYFLTKAFPLPLELQAVISKTALTHSYSKPGLIQASN